MRFPKRYLKRVVKKRLIEFILTFSVISIISFGVFTKFAISGTGILYQFGDDWYIKSNFSKNPMYSYFKIHNPQYFPHVLIPENNGTEVHYNYKALSSYLAHLGPHSVYVFTIDLVPIFLIKISIFYICIVISSISSIFVFTYLYLNRKRFPIKNKLLG